MIPATLFLPSIEALAFSAVLNIYRMQKDASVPVLIVPLSVLFGISEIVGAIQARSYVEPDSYYSPFDV